MGRGLYIHVPFCRKKCSYCDFYSLTDQQQSHAGYLAGLQQELSAYQGMTVDTVFLGGGTPSLLAASEVSAVLSAVSRYLHLAPNAEISMEMNPGAVSRAYLAGCAMAGITRLSLGVQSFSPQLLQQLSRIHTADEAIQAVNWAETVGFAHVNLDLIYGIPGQTMEHWQQTLQVACGLPVDHLSLYALEVHAETPLGRGVASGQSKLPNEDLVADMYQLARELLPGQGFAQYEISNFARAGGACRHNLNYWQNGEYIGIGPAACSYLRGERYCDAPDYPAWSEALLCGEQPPRQKERLSLRESMVETMILGLRLTAGVDEQSFSERYGQTIRQAFGPLIESLLQVGRLQKTASGYALPEQLVPVANQVFLAFID
jgi:oxygen-independent coproporphyrinogen-3 oxidase